MELHYDYIIVGAGCAGLGVAVRFSLDPFFKNKKILILEPEDKNKNNRTWSFWSREEKFYHGWAIKSWPKVIIKDDQQTIETEAHPHNYYTIRGIDYYSKCKEQIVTSKNITWKKELVSEVKNLAGFNHCICESGNEYLGQHIFDSRFPEKLKLDNSNFLWQHFKGWVIRSTSESFDEETALLMDFSIDQKNETRFFYVLPFSKKEALIEIAIFSEEVLSSKDFDKLIKAYIQENYPNLTFEIIEEEYNKIPMTDHVFSQPDSKYHYYIGGASGSVKSSSGYAFTRIQKQCEKIVHNCKEGKDIILESKDFAPGKYELLDATLLNVIVNERVSGKEIFMRLFAKNKASTIFDFLDEKSSIFQELKIMLSLPWIPFIKSFTEEIRKRLN